LLRSSWHAVYLYFNGAQQLIKRPELYEEIAIESLGTRKRERVDNLEQQLWLEVARMRVFKMWESKGKDILFSATRLHDDAKW
jgi:thioesterase domain-containing protein